VSVRLRARSTRSAVWEGASLALSGSEPVVKGVTLDFKSSTVRRRDENSPFAGVDVASGGAVSGAAFVGVAGAEVVGALSGTDSAAEGGLFATG
jgi:hypothetical protein